MEMERLGRDLKQRGEAQREREERESALALLRRLGIGNRQNTAAPSLVAAWQAGMTCEDGRKREEEKEEYQIVTRSKLVKMHSVLRIASDDSSWRREREKRARRELCQTEKQQRACLCLHLLLT